MFRLPLIILISMFLTTNAFADKWVSNGGEEGEKYYIYDKLETEDVSILVVKNGVTHFVLGNVIIRKQLVSYDEAKIHNGKFYNHFLYINALLCGEDLYGYYRLYEGIYNRETKPNAELLEFDRVQYWDFREPKFRDFEKYIKLASKDGRYSKLCKKYGNQLDTKFIIGSNEEISLLELAFKDLIEDYDVVSFNEWYSVNSQKNVKQNSSKSKNNPKGAVLINITSDYTDRFEKNSLSQFVLGKNILCPSYTPFGGKFKIEKNSSTFKEMTFLESNKKSVNGGAYKNESYIGIDVLENKQYKIFHGDLRKGRGSQVYMLVMDRGQESGDLYECEVK